MLVADVCTTHSLSFGGVLAGAASRTAATAAAGVTASAEAATHDLWPEHANAGQLVHMHVGANASVVCASTAMCSESCAHRVLILTFTPCSLSRPA